MRTNMCMWGKYIILLLLALPSQSKKERKKLELDPVEEKKIYDSHHVVEVEIKNEANLQWLNKIRRYDPDLDFWKKPLQVGDKAHIMIHNDHVESVDKLFEQTNLAEKKTIVENVDELFNNFFKRFERRRKDKASRLKFIPDDYHPLLMIEDEVKSRAEKKCPAGLQCEVSTIGQTNEGHDIYLYKIQKENPGMNSYLLVSGLRGRDWFSMATNLIFADILTGWYAYPDAYPNIQTLLEDGAWYFVFVANPDGYSFTWTDDRLWRKNRQAVQEDAQCKGIDLNTNFNYKWTESGESNNLCMNNYKGLEPASEPETKAIQDLIEKLGSSLKLVINLEDYGPYIRMPWGDVRDEKNLDNSTRIRYETCKKSADHATQVRAIEGFTENSCSPPNLPVGGDLAGYAHFVAGVPYAYDIAFHDDDRQYLPFGASLNHAGEELVAAVVTTVYMIRDEPFPKYIVQNPDPYDAIKDEL